MRVRCITINLKGLHLDWFGARSSIFIEGLRIRNPDMICFQEAAVRRQTPFYNQARMIAHELGLKYTLFCPYGNPHELVAQEQGGIAIASRWQISDARIRKLPPGHRGLADSRVAIFALIDMPQGGLGVVNTHLSWRPEETEIRLMQVGILLEELGNNPWWFSLADEKMILLGDLNACPDEPAILAVSDRLKDAYGIMHPSESGYTWSSKNPFTHGENLPDRRIDYIFSDRRANIRRCEIILDRPAPTFASDHFGVFAELEW